MSFSYTNTTSADDYVRSVALGVDTNYARVTDDPQLARISNKTASLEQPELITYRSKPVAKVETQIPVRHPSPVRDGVLYSVRVESINRITNSDGSLTDEPIVMWLNVMHPMSNNWDNGTVAGVFTRLASALMKDQDSSGTPAAISNDEWRFEDLMKSALMPASD